MMISTWFNAGLMAIYLATPAWPGDLPKPEGRVLLEVTGNISNYNADGMAQFDMAMLRALDWRDVQTYTSFTDGEQRFSGPTLRSLLDVVSASGTTLNATAINDYFVQIPFNDAVEHGVILAAEMNGKQMRLRDRGPIWVIYPLSKKQAEKKVFDAEMIWQMNRLEVIE